MIFSPFIFSSSTFNTNKRHFIQRQINPQQPPQWHVLFTTPRELKAIIAARNADVVRKLTEKLLSYALCRPLEGYDEFVVDRVLESLAKDDNRLQTLITEVVLSYPFTHRRVR